MATQIIQSGDTLSALAQKNNTTVANLMALNPQITNPNLIYAGKPITISAESLSNPATPAPVINYTAPEVSQANPVSTQPTQTNPYADLLKSLEENKPTQPDVSQQETNISAGKTALLESQQAQRSAQAESDVIANKLKQISDRQALEKQQNIEAVRQGGINATGANARDITFARQQAIKDNSEIYALNSQSYAAQAKIAQASGDVQTATTLLGFAQDELNNKYKMERDYQTSLYNWKNDMINKVWDIATKDEQAKLNAKKLQNEQDFQLKRDELARQHDIDMANLNNRLKSTTQNTPTAIADEVNNILASPENNTPVAARAILSNLVGNKAVSSGVRSKIAPAVEVLNAAEELAGLNQNGKFVGTGGVLGLAPAGQWFKGIFNMQDKEYQNNVQALEAINLKTQQWASGAALTDQQTKQVKKLTPNVYDSDKTIRNKINGLYNFMLNQAEGNLLTEGINVQFPSVNLFETYDLYQKASPDQKKEIEKLINQK